MTLLWEIFVIFFDRTDTPTIRDNVTVHLQLSPLFKSGSVITYRPEQEKFEKLAQLRSSLSSFYSLEFTVYSLETW